MTSLTVCVKQPDRCQCWMTRRSNDWLDVDGAAAR